ncbi:hypothetical protein ACOMHN_038928 [Nucella lapillus]
MGTRGNNAGLLLMIALYCLAWKTSLSQSVAAGKYAQYPPTTVLENITCALPEVVDAASTRSISLRAGHLVQDFEEVCPSYPNGGPFNGTFRTADGTCNHRFNLGAANRPPKRLLSNAYEDGVDLPRTKGVDKNPLRSPTAISQSVHSNKTVSQGFTVMLMQWGQFLDHDITGFPITSEVDESIECCGPERTFPNSTLNSECFPMQLSSEDNRFVGDCMEFARSVAARNKYGAKLEPREPINSVTAFIDGSMVYGSNQELQDELRERVGNPSDPKLLATMRTTPQDLLPSNSEANCIFDPSKNEHCFLAGDTRVNEQPGLAAIHTMFVRVHNEIVRDLRLLRPQDSEEKLFQLTRKIVGAIIQNIHYGEWLPLIIGRRTMIRYGLRLSTKFEYLRTVDPRIANAFSTAAFRFGHSLIPDVFVIGGKDKPLRNLFGQVFPLFDNFNNMLLSLSEPNTLGEQGGAQTADRFFTSEITEHLFETEPLDVNSSNSSTGLDLVALNIQRGRDHGLPPYNQYRRLCGLRVLRKFSDFDAPLDTLYKDLYSSVHDVDLFSGIMSERPIRGAIVGETLACLLGNQFHELKFGDRFFFQNQLPLGFTDVQQGGIRGITMAHLCCLVKGIRKVQQNLFRVPGNRNELQLCSNLRKEFKTFLEIFENFP